MRSGRHGGAIRRPFNRFGVAVALSLLFGASGTALRERRIGEPADVTAAVGDKLDRGMFERWREIGLGLAISRQRVELTDGAITVASTDRPVGSAVAGRSADRRF